MSVPLFDVGVPDGSGRACVDVDTAHRQHAHAAERLGHRRPDLGEHEPRALAPTVLGELPQRGDTARIDEGDVAQYQDAGVRSALDATNDVGEHVRHAKKERALQFQVLDTFWQARTDPGARTRGFCRSALVVLDSRSNDSAAARLRPCGA